MKDKEVISLFDAAHPDTLAGTDLGTGTSDEGRKIVSAMGPGKKRRLPYKPLVAVAAALAVTVVSLLTATVPQAFGLAEPEYPAGVPFDKRNRASRQELDPVFQMGLSRFAFASASQVFARGDVSENLVYSPLSLFYALALAGEGAAGETRAEILAALQLPEMALGQEAAKLFTNLYTDNEIGKLLLANSLWLSQDVEFNQAYLDKAARDFFAHSFAVDFADAKTAKEISKWVSQHTGGKLGNDPRAFAPDSEQVMSIINTIYFYDQWRDEFDKQLTKDAAFYLAQGGQVAVPFMHRNTFGSFVRTPEALLTSIDFKNEQRMLLLLPAEGMTPQDILTNPESLAAILAALDDETAGYGQIILSLPKFSFQSELDLNPVLGALGIQKAFLPDADFTGLSASRPLFVSQVKQNLTVAIDEKGCEAAAYTEIRLCGSAPPEEIIEMNLDRPFIFVITGAASDAPLFIGVVNNPAK